jgi:hypothetical protein
MKYPKIDPAKSRTGPESAYREPYEPPTVTVVPLKIEERLLACVKLPSSAVCKLTIPKQS